MAPPLVVEFSFELPWVDPDGEEHLLRGIIDRVDEGPNGLAVTDYKSGKSKPKADSIAYFMAEVMALPELRPPCIPR